MGLINDMNPEDLRYLIKLQIEEINEARSRSKKREDDTSKSDLELTIDSVEKILESDAQILADACMAASSGEVVQNDSQEIQKIGLEEATARGDRDLARSLGGVSIQPEEKVDDSLSIADKDFITKLMALNVRGRPKANDGQNESAASCSTSWYTCREQQESQVPKATCVACEEFQHLFDCLDAPCGHTYCRTCIGELFECATRDESLFPPRCCGQTISTKQVKDLVKPEVLLKLEEKLVEFTTENRVYCQVPTCSSFIPPESMLGQTANCAACGAKTCTECKGPDHANFACPEDPGLTRVLELVQSQGWRQCDNCKQTIELDQGCNHMTCRCGHQFCYVCGLRWKSCDCPQWEEARLLSRARDIVGRPGEGLYEFEGFERFAEALWLRIQRMAEELRENHECVEHRYRFVRGRHACEACQSVMPKFVFECQHCHRQVCRRCRLNRD